MGKERAYRENRRYWLARWLEEAGGPKRLAELVDSVDTHLIAMARGRRNVGDDLAEKIERKLGHEFGSMDRDPPDGAIAQAPNTDLIIHQYDAGGAMSNGGLILEDRQPGIIKSWRVDPEWLRLNVPVHTGIQNLCIVTGFGPSMQPKYNPGDPLLVDRGVTTVDVEGIFFFRLGNHGYIKQIQRIPTENGLLLRAKSLNRDYDPFDITPKMMGDFEVFGKVLTVWRSEQV